MTVRSIPARRASATAGASSSTPVLGTGAVFPSGPPPARGLAPQLLLLDGRIRRRDARVRQRDGRIRHRDGRIGALDGRIGAFEGRIRGAVAAFDGRIRAVLAIAHGRTCPTAAA